MSTFYMWDFDNIWEMNGSYPYINVRGETPEIEFDGDGDVETPYYVETEEQLYALAMGEAKTGSKIYYQLVNIGLNRYAKGGGQPLVTAGQIKKVIIPVPMMQEQERIVAVLDRFDTLCNDLSAGLPAEIEARRKQYEYYRDKLLSFEELQKK